jgi:hypothetical protein
VTVQVRARVLIALAIVDIALAGLVWIASGASDAMRARAAELQRRTRVRQTLTTQEQQFGKQFEERLRPLQAGQRRAVIAALYDLVDAQILKQVRGLRVKGLDYEAKTAGEYSRLTVRIPVEASAWEAVDRFLGQIEALQAQHWIAVDSLMLEERRIPRRGVGGSATLVLYHRKG